MKKNFAKAASLVTLSALAISCFAAPQNAFAASELKAGDAFKMTGVNAGKNPYVLQILNADLNKDKKNEKIYLVGNRFDKTSNYYDQISYVIQDGKSGKKLIQILKDSSNYPLGGYEPTLALTDLNNDGQKDLFLSAATGGSGGYISYHLSTLEKGNLVTFLSNQDMKGIDVTGKFIDGFKGELTSKALNKTWTVDLTSSKETYIAIGLYDESGKVIGSEILGTGMISSFEIINAYGKNMLKGTQKVKGASESDRIATIELYMSFENKTWTIKSVEQTTVLKAFE